MSKTFDRAVASIGLNDGITDARQKVVFYTTRHAFASWLVQRGVPLYTVAKQPAIPNCVWSSVTRTLPRRA